MVKVLKDLHEDLAVDKARRLGILQMDKIQVTIQIAAENQLLVSQIEIKVHLLNTLGVKDQLDQFLVMANVNQMDIQVVDQVVFFLIQDKAHQTNILMVYKEEQEDIKAVDKDKLMVIQVEDQGH
jgi:hypothetical protein